MKLYYLLKNINCRVVGNTILDIKGLYHKDTEVKEGGMFFSLRGTRVDGSSYVLSAVKNGAVAVVTEQEIQNLSGVTQIIVRDARETMSLIACKFFGNPANKLKIIGVTGTNGKTTVTSIISHIINFSGKKCALIGTNGALSYNLCFLLSKNLIHVFLISSCDIYFIFYSPSCLSIEPKISLSLLI